MNSLAGKCILVTRAAGQCAAVAQLTAQHGATAAYFPCLAVQCLPDNIRKGLSALPENATILLSSSNGVSCAAQALGNDFTSLLALHPVIAVGRHTAAALEKHGIQAAWAAAQASQEGLIQGFSDHGWPAAGVYFLRAEDGRDVLQQALQAQGVDVQLIHAYRTICPQDDASDVIRQLQADEIDAVLLGSSRTAQHYVQRIGDAKLADRPAVAVISPQVSAAAKAAGLSVQAVAKEASFASMLNVLNEYFAETYFTKTLPDDAEEPRP